MSEKSFAIASISAAIICGTFFYPPPPAAVSAVPVSATVPTVPASTGARATGKLALLELAAPEKRQDTATLAQFTTPAARK